MTRSCKKTSRPSAIGIKTYRALRPGVIHIRNYFSSLTHTIARKRAGHSTIKPYHSRRWRSGLDFTCIQCATCTPNTSVPVLLSGTTVVEGSNEIITYLEQHSPSPSLTPTDAGQLQTCLEIEHWMDERLGANIRQILYDRLLAYPDYIPHCFTHPMPGLEQIIFRLFYPILQSEI